MTRPEMLLDRYLPLKSLRGGMGVVHLCADFAEGRAVAVKTFLPELLADSEARELFVREASAWLELGAHPHLVTAHMVRREGEQVYVVCDYIAPPDGRDGASLRAWLGPPLEPARTLDFALGICRGMQWACTRLGGLVHRDLKPENVLVGRDLRARVTDFGLAVVRGRAAEGVCGTPRYMAPEQWDGAADVRSDIYAFGLIVLEMFTGAMGITPGGVSAMAAQHRSGAPGTFAASAALPPSLRDVLVATVQRDPAQRPPSWDVVEQWLVYAWPSICGGQPPVLPPPAEATRQERILRAWSENALAGALLDLGQVGDAVNGYRAVLGTAQAEGDPALEAAALGNLGQALCERGAVDEALTTLDAALEKKRALGDVLGEANTLNNRGNALRRKNRMDDAVTDYRRAAEIFVRAGRRREHALSQLNCAPALLALGARDEALGVVRLACATFRELEDWRACGAALGTLGQLLRQSGAMEDALASSDEALACFRRAADRLGEARELSFQGHTLRAMQKMPDALDRFQASLTLAEELGDMLLVGSNSFVLAQMTPPLPQFMSLGRRHAEGAARAYRAAGRDDLAADADTLASRFTPPG